MPAFSLLFSYIQAKNVCGLQIRTKNVKKDTLSVLKTKKTLAFLHIYLTELVNLIRPKYKEHRQSHKSFVTTLFGLRITMLVYGAMNLLSTRNENFTMRNPYSEYPMYNTLHTFDFILNPLFWISLLYKSSFL